MSREERQENRGEKKKKIGEQSFDKEAFLQRTGLDEESYQAFLEVLPELQEAKEKLEQAQRRELETRLQSQLREIMTLDPSVTGAEDLKNQPGYDQLCAMVERGYELADAWKLLHFQDLNKQAAYAGRQEGASSSRGKEHMMRTPMRALLGAQVPQQILSQYRLLNPEATEGEIRSHYNRMLGQSRR
jgi:hypothetical protein